MVALYLPKDGTNEVDDILGIVNPQMQISLTPNLFL